MVIQFDEESHTYKGLIDGKLVSLLNASTFKDIYSPPFDPFPIASQVAKKSGEDPKDIIRKWNMKGKISRDYGTALHNCLEGFVKYDIIPEDSYLKYFLQEYKKLGIEDVVSESLQGNGELKIGGLLDLDSEEKIYDLKTGDFLKAKKGNLKAPFNFLPNNPLGKATLQLNFYRLFDGNEDKELEVLYWNGETFERIELERIDLDIIRKEINKYYENERDV